MLKNSSVKSRKTEGFIVGEGGVWGWAILKLDKQTKVTRMEVKAAFPSEMILLENAENRLIYAYLYVR